MRKILREGINYDKTAEKVVAIIKGKGHNVILFTIDGMETTDPELARRFYVKEPNYMITIDEDNALIKINKNSNVELEEIEPIIKQMRNLARNYMLNTELKVFGKEIAPKDFAFQAKKYRENKMNNVSEAYKGRTYRPVKSKLVGRKIADQHGNVGKILQVERVRSDLGDIKYRFWVEFDKDVPSKGGIRGSGQFSNKGYVSKDRAKLVDLNEASLSRMHGSKKTSYQTLESVKLVVRHRKSVDEESRGSRSRQIKEIFIERGGERFRFPHNHLAGARAMARHISEGGEMHDSIGAYIVESVANLKKLAEFVRYSRSNKLINEQSEDIIKIVRENISAYKRELNKFQGASSYHKMCEKIANREGSDVEIDETDELKDMFTVRKFDETIGETLPLIKRLVMEKNAWRSMIEEASTERFAVTSSEDLIENDALEFDSPVQKLGYKIRALAERVVEESELSKFVAKTGNKLIEGNELTKFEKSVIKNVLENIDVAEEDEENEDGFVDKLEEAMSDFERKIKILEYGMSWDDEVRAGEKESGATGMGHPIPYCPDCDGEGEFVDGTECLGCGGSGRLDRDGAVREDEDDWDSVYNYDEDEEECRSCEGYGTRDRTAVNMYGEYEPCPDCQGTGMAEPWQPVGEDDNDELGKAFIDDYESKVADNNPCMYCDGEGCEVCGGQEEMFEKDPDPEDFMDECPNCKGSGKEPNPLADYDEDDSCIMCHGEGYV